MEDFAQFKKKVQRSLAKVRKEHERKREAERIRDEFAYAYAPSLISYLDVLGMKDLLVQSEEDASRVGKVLNTFRVYGNVAHDETNIWELTVVNFSDLVVRTIPLLSETNVQNRLGCFFNEVWNLGYVQSNLVSRGWLLRGAMTKGNICVQNGLIFGPGLARGHQLETTARWPRIVIDDELMSAVEADPLLRAEDNTFDEEMSYLPFVQRDADGCWFINYLAQMQTESDSPEQYAFFLEQHQLLIEKQRSEVCALQPGALHESRLDKLKWLIRLHNSHLEQTKASVFFGQTGLWLDHLTVSEWPD